MVYDNLPDDSLLNECRNGNITAYEVLFERYFKVLYAFSLKYTKNEAIAEELVMDLMLQIWLKRNELRIEGNLSSYLFGAIKNRVFNYLRKKERTTIPIESVPRKDFTINGTTDYNVRNRELEIIFRLKLEQLSPSRRKIFILSRDQQMTYPEIARSLNISVNTVKSQMLATLKFFRESLKDHTDLSVFILFLFCLLR